MKDIDDSPRLLPPPSAAAKAPSRNWTALLRPPKLWRTIAAGSSSIALILGAIVWARGSGIDQQLVQIGEMQRQVAILQSQHNAGSANVAGIQGQLAGLQTQLLVLQNQMIQLQRGTPLPLAAQPASAPTPPARPVGGVDAKIPPARSHQSGNTPVVEVHTKPPSAAELSRLINEGLKGKDRASDPIYQQIMYSALDLGSAYQVSIAAWGPNPSPLAEVLQAAKITDFSFKKSNSGETVLIIPRTETLADKLRQVGAKEEKAGQDLGYVLM